MKYARRLSFLWLLSSFLASSLHAADNKPADPVVIGAGDIASCSDLAPAAATAKLLEANPGTVIAIGDLAYSDGSRAELSTATTRPGAA